MTSLICSVPRGRIASVRVGVLGSQLSTLRAIPLLASISSIVAFAQQPPAVTISLKPATIAVGQPATLSWSVAGASSCLAATDPFSGTWNGATAANGTKTVTQTAPGIWVYALTCAGNGGSASASATLTVTSSGTAPAVTEAITDLPPDITPLLSIAGIWQPVANQYLRFGANGGDGNGSIIPYAQNILLANGREGIVAAGWSCCDARTSDNTSAAGKPITPVNIAILEQQPDGSLRLATSKYANDPQTNGAGRVLVGDFNRDGIQDFFLPAYNESPFQPASSTAYVSRSDGTYSKITVGDFVEGHGGTVEDIKDSPTVFVVGYNANCSYTICIPNSYVWNGSNGFTIVPQTGMQTASSIAVGDFYGDGTYSAVYGDMNAGVNLPNVPNWVNGLYLYHLSGLIPAGNPAKVGEPYFNDKPEWAQYVGHVDPHGETHSYHTFLDDFNHDGQLDIVVQDSIYPFAPNGGPNILQMFKNVGNYTFTDVTDVLDPQYDPYTTESDYDPQVRDLDHSGINSYLFAAHSYSTQVAASNYLIVNDGSGNLRPALHETLNRYGQQVIAWLATQPSLAAFSPFSAPQPDVRLYQTADGKLNCVAIVWIRNGTATTAPTLEQYVFVNVPLKLDLASQFTKPIVVQNRNGSHLIRTFAGDDTIYSGNSGGYSKVDGGLGTNTVVYSGPSQHYSATHNADGTWTIKDNVGSDGTDTLARIQRLQFTDIVVRLDSQATPGPAASVTASAGNNQTAPVNTAFPVVFQATVRDFLGNPVPNVGVTFTAPNSGATGVFPGSALSATVTTNSAGVATAPVFTANGTAGTVKVTATVAGVVAPTVFSLTITPPAGAIASVTVAGGGTDIAQNTWIVIKGTRLVPGNTPAAGVNWSGAPEFASGFMPTQLGGYLVTVTVNNKPAYLYFFCSAETSSTCASDQINVLTPLDNTLGPVPIVVTNNGVATSAFLVNMRPAAPAFALVGATQYIVATHADYSLVGPASLSVPGYPFTPARPGETIILYGFGFGLPAAALTNGSSSQSGSLPVLPVVQIGGAPATVTFAGLIGPGLYQFNVIVPGTAQSGDNSLTCSYNGATSPAGAWIAVQP